MREGLLRGDSASREAPGRGAATSGGDVVKKGSPTTRAGGEAVGEALEEGAIAGARRRVPAAERREALIAAAVHEFAVSGLHGTPVDRIARRVGVAQPYVFSLFAGKRDLFLSAVDHCFDRFLDTFAGAAAEYRAGRAPEDCEDVLMAMGGAYKQLLSTDRDYLMLQHQAYAACDDELVRARVRRRYAGLVAFVEELSGAEPERLDDFFRHGMALNVAAAMDVAELSAGCSWVQAELGERSSG
ncbi:MAG TPA: TetR/AcrR family transcriptional regulator [Solirubrobacteraceae bacterium]|jgi:AcrR family transcriptional regulator|nr:TetR/AcrR family transcriptional regulator [Solirubrobacteraceae bacterium]